MFRPRASMVVCLAALSLGCARRGPLDLSRALARYEGRISRPGKLSRVPLDPEAPIRVLPRASWSGPTFTAADSDADAPTDPEDLPRSRGPAYPGDFWRSLEHLARKTPAILWDDTKATVQNRFSLAALAAAGIAGAVIAQSDIDDDVADHYTRHGGELNKFWDSVGGFGGNPGLHIPVAGAMVFTTMALDDVENYERSKTLLFALGLNGIVTQSLKWAARTEVPNGAELGWPSGHTSSSFCAATVLYHQHGPWVGVPLFAFATFVAYERVDARNHDFSDVVSGSLIGIAIGHAVVGNHETSPLGMEILPYIDPQRRVVGLALRKSW